MEAAGHVYMAIDLKSFYASVECIERNLDPLTTNLVVADTSKTEKTICLAVSPSLKQYGISGRARLFEVIQKVKEVNFQKLTIYMENGEICPISVRAKTSLKKYYNEHLISIGNTVTRISKKCNNE